MAQFTAPRMAEMVIAMRAESSAGVDPMAGTVLSADIVPVVWDSYRFTQDPNEIVNKMTAGHLGRISSILGALTGMVEFKMYFRGRGVAYATGTRPEMDMPMRACRHSSTVDTTGGLEKVTWQPTSTEELYTVYTQLRVPGGATSPFIKLTGALGTFGYDSVAGGLTEFTFRIGGSLDRADHAYVAGTLSLTPPFPTMKSAAFQIGSTNYAPRIKNVGFQQNNVLRYLESINAASGVAGQIVMDREPTLQINPELDLEANSGWWTALSTGAPLKDCTFQLGTAQYNRLKFQFGAAAVASLQVVGQGVENDGGVTRLPTTLRATITAGNDDYALVAD